MALFSLLSRDSSFYFTREIIVQIKYAGKVFVKTKNTWMENKVYCVNNSQLRIDCNRHCMLVLRKSRELLSLYRHIVS